MEENDPKWGESHKVKENKKRFEQIDLDFEVVGLHLDLSSVQWDIHVREVTHIVAPFHLNVNLCEVVGKEGESDEDKECGHIEQRNRGGYDDPSLGGKTQIDAAERSHYLNNNTQDT